MPNSTSNQLKGSRVVSAGLDRNSLSGCFSKVKSTTARRPKELRGPFLRTQKSINQ